MNGQNRVKASSVAAFLFMPQFRLSFQHMSHIAPVFMRTLALMFVQAGMIARNHPATMYGMEGVQKVTFGALMAEAWHYLRTKDGTLYQWGLFTSVVTMVGFMFAFVTVFFAQVFVGVGAAAQAQIFDHPNGATDFTPGAGSPLGAASGGYYDKTIPAANNAHGDYGIMMLDKVLRVGADGVANGPLQDALQSLMQVYNSGVLVIAGVMLFWAILSVVLDTAKTGTIGGGRHNLVWAPIRIVFALGLLIPLGANGFSSGQYAIMKLAEWGSNFGTRAWVAYANGVLSNSSMVGALHGSNPTALVNDYNNIWLCRIAYNGYSAQANTLNADTQVAAVASPPDTGSTTVKFGNKADASLCGTITYRNESDAMTQMSLAAFTPGAVSIGAVKQNMMQAYKAAVDGLEAPAKALACEFVAEYIYDTTAGSPLVNAGLCSAGEIGTQNDGNLGAQARLSPMVSGFATAIEAALGNARGTLQGYVISPAFISELEGRGWAGMGMWYHRVSEMNKVAQAFRFPTVSISPGTWQSSGGDSEQVKKLSEIMKKYDEWWKASSVILPATAAAPQGAQTVSSGKANTTVDTSTGGDFLGFAKNIATQSPMSFFGTVVARMTGMGEGTDTTPFWFDIVEKEDPDVYPLAELSSTGTQILTIGITIISAISLGPILMGLLPSIKVFGIGIDFGNIGMILAESQITQMLGTIGMAMVLSGALLSYYVPIIPFIRTSLSVMTWITSVFEATMMVPIAALAHITTEGEGITGSAGNVWKIWLNILLRPVLTVGGFVGALLIFNAFVVYFNDAFVRTLSAGQAAGTAYSIIDGLLYTVVYVMAMYTAANTAFKMLDIIPNAAMKYLGGQGDTSFDDNNTAEYLTAGTNLIRGSGGGFGAGAAKTLKGMQDKRASTGAAGVSGASP